MNLPERIKQHQTIQRENPHLTPDQVELLLLGGTLQPDPAKPEPAWVEWLCWMLVPAVMLLGAFLGSVTK